VGHTFYFLTATWLAAQSPADIWTRDVSPCGCQRSYSDSYVHAVGSWGIGASSGCGCSQGYVGDGYQDHQGILARIQGRLSGLANLLPWRHQAEEGEIVQGDGGMMSSSSSPVLALPSGRSSEPPLADQPAPRSPVAPANFHAAPPATSGLLLIEPEPK
jgi:hypothetical protein